MNIKKQLEKDVKYLSEEEDFQLLLRDGCEKYSEDYNYHQNVFGIMCRARIRAEREIISLGKGEAIPN